MNWFNRVRTLTDGRDLSLALQTADIGITEADQPDAEAFFNSNGVSHIIVDIRDFDLYGDAGCVCGVVAAHGDEYAKYDVCPDCVSGWAA